ncbi:MAG: hypothetical protein IPP74_10500 [Alphaproteobacteria bacterium]|nr:hypothetical protein [Alphaproteobacteria bacterium]
MGRKKKTYNTEDKRLPTTPQEVEQEKTRVVVERLFNGYLESISGTKRDSSVKDQDSLFKKKIEDYITLYNCIAEKGLFGIKSLKDTNVNDDIKFLIDETLKIEVLVKDLLNDNDSVNAFKEFTAKKQPNILKTVVDYYAARMDPLYGELLEVFQNNPQLFVDKEFTVWLERCHEKEEFDFSILKEGGSCHNNLVEEDRHRLESISDSYHSIKQEVSNFKKSELFNTLEEGLKNALKPAANKFKDLSTAENLFTFGKSNEGTSAFIRRTNELSKKQQKKGLEFEEMLSEFHKKLGKAEEIQLFIRKLESSPDGTDNFKKSPFKTDAIEKTLSTSITNIDNKNALNTTWKALQNIYVDLPHEIQVELTRDAHDVISGKRDVSNFISNGEAKGESLGEYSNRLSHLHRGEKSVAFLTAVTDFNKIIAPHSEIQIDLYTAPSSFDQPLYNKKLDDIVSKQTAIPLTIRKAWERIQNAYQTLSADLQIEAADHSRNLFNSPLNVAYSRYIEKDGAGGMIRRFKSYQGIYVRAVIIQDISQLLFSSSVNQGEKPPETIKEKLDAIKNKVETGDAHLLSGYDAKLLGVTAERWTSIAKTIPFIQMTSGAAGAQVLAELAGEKYTEQLNGFFQSLDAETQRSILFQSVGGSITLCLHDMVSSISKDNNINPDEKILLFNKALNIMGQGLVDEVKNDSTIVVKEFCKEARTVLAGSGTTDAKLDNFKEVVNKYSSNPEHGFARFALKKEAEELQKKEKIIYYLKNITLNVEIQEAHIDRGNVLRIMSGYQPVFLHQEMIDIARKLMDPQYHPEYKLNQLDTFKDKLDHEAEHNYLQTLKKLCDVKAYPNINADNTLIAIPGQDLYFKPDDLFQIWGNVLLVKASTELEKPPSPKTSKIFNFPKFKSRAQLPVSNAEQRKHAQALVEQISAAVNLVKVVEEAIKTPLHKIIALSAQEGIEWTDWQSVNDFMNTIDLQFKRSAELRAQRNIFDKITNHLTINGVSGAIESILQKLDDNMVAFYQAERKSQQEIFKETKSKKNEKEDPVKEEKWIAKKPSKSTSPKVQNSATIANDSVLEICNAIEERSSSNTEEKENDRQRAVIDNQLECLKGLESSIKEGAFGGGTVAASIRTATYSKATRIPSLEPNDIAKTMLSGVKDTDRLMVYTILDKHGALSFGMQSYIQKAVANKIKELHAQSEPQTIKQQWQSVRVKKENLPIRKIDISKEGNEFFTRPFEEMPATETTARYKTERKKESKENSKEKRKEKRKKKRNPGNKSGSFPLETPSSLNSNPLFRKDSPEFKFFLNISQNTDKKDHGQEWATGTGINNILHICLGSTHAHIVHPDQLSTASPFADGDVAKEAFNSIKETLNTFKGNPQVINPEVAKNWPEIDIPKPVVMVLNTGDYRLSEAENEQIKNQQMTVTATNAGSHWVTCVILPKQYKPPQGDPLNNEKELVFLIDSLGPRTISDAFKNALTKDAEYTVPSDFLPEYNEENGKRIILAPLPDAEFPVIPESKQQVGCVDCGWWATYNALMVVLTGRTDYMNQFKGDNRAPAEALRYCWPALSGEVHTDIFNKEDSLFHSSHNTIGQSTQKKQQQELAKKELVNNQEQHVQNCKIAILKINKQTLHSFLADKSDDGKAILDAAFNAIENDLSERGVNVEGSTSPRDEIKQHKGKTGLITVRNRYVASCRTAIKAAISQPLLDKINTANSVDETTPNHLDYLEKRLHLVTKVSEIKSGIELKNIIANLPNDQDLTRISNAFIKENGDRDVEEFCIKCVKQHFLEQVSIAEDALKKGKSQVLNVVAEEQQSNVIHEPNPIPPNEADWGPWQAVRDRVEVGDGKLTPQQQEQFYIEWLVRSKQINADTHYNKINDFKQNLIGLYERIVKITENNRIIERNIPPDDFDNHITSLIRLIDNNPSSFNHIESRINEINPRLLAPLVPSQSDIANNRDLTGAQKLEQLVFNEWNISEENHEKIPSRIFSLESSDKQGKNDLHSWTTGTYVKISRISGIDVVHIIPSATTANKVTSENRVFHKLEAGERNREGLKNKILEQQIYFVCDAYDREVEQGFKGGSKSKDLIPQAAKAIAWNIYRAYSQNSVGENTPVGELSEQQKLILQIENNITVTLSAGILIAPDHLRSLFDYSNKTIKSLEVQIAGKASKDKMDVKSLNQLVNGVLTQSFNDAIAPDAYRLNALLPSVAHANLKIKLHEHVNADLDNYNKASPKPELPSHDPVKLARREARKLRKDLLKLIKEGRVSKGQNKPVKLTPDQQSQVYKLILSSCEANAPGQLNLDSIKGKVEGPGELDDIKGYLLAASRRLFGNPPVQQTKDKDIDFQTFGYGNVDHYGLRSAMTLMGLSEEQRTTIWQEKVINSLKTLCEKEINIIEAKNKEDNIKLEECKSAIIHACEDNKKLESAKSFYGSNKELFDQAIKALYSDAKMSDVLGALPFANENFIAEFSELYNIAKGKLSQITNRTFNADLDLAATYNRLLQNKTTDYPTQKAISSALWTFASDIKDRYVRLLDNLPTAKRGEESDRKTHIAKKKEDLKKINSKNIAESVNLEQIKSINIEGMLAEEIRIILNELVTKVNNLPQPSVDKQIEFWQKKNNFWVVIKRFMNANAAMCDSFADNLRADDSDITTKPALSPLIQELLTPDKGIRSAINAAYPNSADEKNKLIAAARVEFRSVCDKQLLLCNEHIKICNEEAERVVQEAQEAVSRENAERLKNCKTYILTPTEANVNSLLAILSQHPDVVRQAFTDIEAGLQTDPMALTGDQLTAMKTKTAPVIEMVVNSQCGNAEELANELHNYGNTIGEAIELSDHAKLVDENNQYTQALGIYYTIPIIQGTTQESQRQHLAEQQRLHAQRQGLEQNATTAINDYLRIEYHTRNADAGDNESLDKFIERKGHVLFNEHVQGKEDVQVQQYITSLNAQKERDAKTASLNPVFNEKINALFIAADNAGINENNYAVKIDFWQAVIEADTQNDFVQAVETTTIAASNEKNLLLGAGQKVFGTGANKNEPEYGMRGAINAVYDADDQVNTWNILKHKLVVGAQQRVAAAQQQQQEEEQVAAEVQACKIDIINGHARNLVGATGHIRLLAFNAIEADMQARGLNIEAIIHARPPVENDSAVPQVDLNRYLSACHEEINTSITQPIIESVKQQLPVPDGHFAANRPNLQRRQDLLQRVAAINSQANYQNWHAEEPLINVPLLAAKDPFFRDGDAVVKQFCIDSFNTQCLRSVAEQVELIDRAVNAAPVIAPPIVAPNPVIAPPIVAPNPVIAPPIVAPNPIVAANPAPQPVAAKQKQVARGKAKQQQRDKDPEPSLSQESKPFLFDQTDKPQNASWSSAAKHTLCSKWGLAIATILVLAIFCAPFLPVVASFAAITLPTGLPFLVTLGGCALAAGAFGYKANAHHSQQTKAYQAEFKAQQRDQGGSNYRDVVSKEQSKTLRDKQTGKVVDLSKGSGRKVGG